MPLGRTQEKAQKILIFHKNPVIPRGTEYLQNKSTTQRL